jgi:hypothetical protein
VTVSLTLPGTETAVLDVFDLSGRRAFSKRLEGLSAGQHRVEFATRLRAGVYFGRLTQGVHTAARRFAVMR